MSQKRKEFTNWFYKNPTAMSKIIRKCVNDEKNFISYVGVFTCMMGIFETLKSPSNDILLSQFKKNYKEEYNAKSTAIFDKLIDNPIFFYKVPLTGTDDYVICPVFDFSNMNAVEFVKMQNAAFTQDIDTLHKLSPYRGRNPHGISSATLQAYTNAEQSAYTQTIPDEEQNGSDNEEINSNSQDTSNNIVIVRDKVTVKDKKKTVKKKLDCSDSSINDFNLEKSIKGLSLEHPKVKNALKQADSNQQRIIRENWELAKTLFYETVLGRKGDDLKCEADVLTYLFNFVNRKSTREEFVNKICERKQEDTPKSTELDPYRFEQVDEHGNRSYNGIHIPPGTPPRPTPSSQLMNGKWRRA